MLTAMNQRKLRFIGLYTGGAGTYSFHIPKWAEMVWLVGIGGAGGGGGGFSGVDAATNRGGGAGGSTANSFVICGLARMFPSSMNVTPGAGGNGGPPAGNGSAGATCRVFFRPIGTSNTTDLVAAAGGPAGNAGTSTLAGTTGGAPAAIAEFSLFSQTLCHRFMTGAAGSAGGLGSAGSNTGHNNSNPHFAPGSGGGGQGAAADFSGGVESAGNSGLFFPNGVNVPGGFYFPMWNFYHPGMGGASVRAGTGVSGGEGALGCGGGGGGSGNPGGSGGKGGDGALWVWVS